jgi:hypothetical protein
MAKLLLVHVAWVLNPLAGIKQNMPRITRLPEKSILGCGDVI